MTFTPQPAPEGAPWATMEQVAEHLQLTIPTIRSWVRRGIIPPWTYIQVSTVYRFDLHKVVQALQNTTPVPPPVEVNPEPVQLELDFGPDEDL